MHRPRPGRGLFALVAAAFPLAFTGQAQAPAGPFEDLRSMTPALQRCFPAFVPGDVDGNGTIDLVVLDQGLVLSNDGLGRYEVARSYSESGIAGWWLYGTLADLDGDGDADLLAGGPCHPLDLLLNDGTGTFELDTARLPAPPPFCQPNECTIRPCLWSPNLLATADFDGDGSTDVYWEGSLFLNDGSGNFADASARLPNVPAWGVPFAVDFDDDGDPDLVVYGFESGTSFGCFLFRNDGGASFSAEPLGIPGYPVVVADLDSDGHVDLIAGADLYLNDGAGTLVAAGTVLPPWFDQASAADVDGDGDLDLLVGSTARYGLVGLKLLSNEGGARFVEAVGALPAELPCSFVRALVDVDRDGDVDVAFGNALWLGDGEGRFTDVSGGPPGRQTPHAALALGDVDGDGLADALTSVQTTAWAFELELLRNDGLGGFERVSGAVPGVEADWVRLFDGDRDGDLDAVAGSATGPLYLENEKGAFVARPASLPARFEAWNAVMADVDVDGDLDLVYSAVVGRAVRLHLNDGNGVFEGAASRITGAGVDVRWIDAGDVDGDGAPDLLVARDGAQNGLLANDGNGTFTARAGALPAHTDRSRSALLADLDGDGDLDALFGNTYSYNLPGRPRFYRNDGRGTFTDSSDDWHAYSFESPMRAVDVDGDGDLDVVGSNNELFLNDGTGVLDYASLPTASWGREMAVADVDLDGDQDVWLSGYPALHVNTTRALAWRSTPRIGKPLTLDVYGPAGTPWLLFVSEGRARPGKGSGRLLLDPRTQRVAGHGRLDVRGRAARTFQVPADPALVGRSLFWQALVGVPKSRTNLERTLFTDL